MVRKLFVFFGTLAITGSVGHLSAWNADVLYESITMRDVFRIRI